MEGSEEKSVKSQPLGEDDKQEAQQPEHFGLGFESSPPSSASVHNSDPRLEPSSPTNDLTQQSINEELLNPQQNGSGELQNQQPISGELENVLEEFQNLVLEFKDEAHDGNVEDDEGEKRDMDHGEAVEANENEGGFKEEEEETDDGSDDKNENDVAKDEDDMVGNGGYRSENEEGVQGNESVGDDSLAVESSVNEKYGRYLFPLRPDAEDCSFYMRNGSCKFGSGCKFNHPPRRRNQVAKDKVKENEDNPEKIGQSECKYFLRSGGCKFGNACRYNHTKGRTTVAPIIEFNFLGLPIRPGDKECPYYMRNGSCKYGSNCRFNHPDPTAVRSNSAGYGSSKSVTLQGAPQSTVSSWSSPRTLNETAPFGSMMFSPTQGFPSPNMEWNDYQASAYTVPEGSLPTPPAFARNSIVPDTNIYAHHQQPIILEEFPERPGQPECSYFMKTGDCKFRSGCRFHHPKNRMPNTPQYTLSDKGLPLRPDQNVCTHYNRYGICKFGPACKFDHPVNFSDSASSMASGPEHHPPAFGHSMMAGGGGGHENGSEPLFQQHV